MVWIWNLQPKITDLHKNVKILLPNLHPLLFRNANSDLNNNRILNFNAGSRYCLTMKFERKEWPNCFYRNDTKKSYDTFDDNYCSNYSSDNLLALQLGLGHSDIFGVRCPPPYQSLLLQQCDNWYRNIQLSSYRQLGLGN